MSKQQTRLMLVTDAVGGVWTYSVELARSLREWDIETILAVIGPSSSSEQRREATAFKLIDTGLDLDWTAERPDTVRRTGCGLAELATEIDADLVQLGSAALLADSHFDQPVVVVQHSCVATWWNAVREGPLPRDFAWRRDLVECGLHGAAAVVAPSAAFAAQLARAYGLSRAVRCVHNGRRALPMKRRDPEDFVFTVGRLWDDGKNVRTLDDAAAKLKVPVEAVGPLNGPNGTAVSFDNLRMPGELRPGEIADRLAARPIFASSALYEPFGLSVLEAAQAGCALVLSDIPTFRELWGGSAVFVPADNADGFADAIEQLLANPDRRAELGPSARVRALRYSPESMGSRMAQLYADLVEQAQTQPAQAQSAFAQFAGAA
jgi:glycosyltransferase involved in cell wall biosynthesis